MAGTSGGGLLRIAAFDWLVPFTEVWDGRVGACRAEMAEDAVGPDVAELTTCGRVVLMPVAASAFPEGHNPRAGFLRVGQPACSDASPFVPLDATEPAERVEVDEEVEANEDDEFCLCAVFRGAGPNILLTSSEFMAPCPLLPDTHPDRESDWKVKAGATAVVIWFVVLLARLPARFHTLPSPACAARAFRVSAG